MLNHMRNTNTGLSLLLAAFCLLWLAACGSDAPLVQRADQFDGGALSNFGGTFGADPDARATAREIASGRSYDFSLSGFDILPGGAESGGPGGSPFGLGTGTVALDGDNATVELDITSTDPNVTNVHMTGTFSLAQATAAIASPGASFVVNWLISFDTFGTPVSLTAEQTLMGTDFVSQ